jgi:RNA polymerase sigma-70 factor (ECF subfamily)
MSDNEIIALYREEKDKELIGYLFSRYTKFVFLVSIKYLKNEDESQDAVMQIFEKLFNDLLIHDIDNFKAWLHTVTRNHCLMKLRKSQKRAEKQKEFQIDSVNFMENENLFHHTEKSQEEINEELVKEAINDLNSEQKKCIELFYLESKSYQEISEITGYSVKNVKSYIQNGKRNLKNNLIKAGISGFIIILILFSI